MAVPHSRYSHPHREDSELSSVAAEVDPCDALACCVGRFDLDFTDEVEFLFVAVPDVWIGMEYPTCHRRWVIKELSDSLQR